MYLPAHFEERRPEVLQTLLREHPLGLLVTQSVAAGNAAPRIETNAIPFIFEPAHGAHGTLVAHVARANPLWREAMHGGGHDGESVVVFQGAQAYVSPAWYPTKAETGKVVPTWNYVIAEARGRLRAIEDPAWVHALVSRLTDTHEAPRELPWAVADAPSDYVDAMLRAIVGIEIELTSLVGKWKVSQNRSAADREGVVSSLAEHADASARAMAGLVPRG